MKVGALIVSFHNANQTKFVENVKKSSYQLQKLHTDYTIIYIYIYIRYSVSFAGDKINYLSLCAVFIVFN